MGDIHLDAAKVIHHFHQRLHVNGDIVVDGELVLVIDDLCQRRDAAVVGQSHRVDLVVGGGVGLAVGKGHFPACGGHQTVAGDLQHPQGTALDIKLAVEDHVRHTVVGRRIAVVAALFVVDAADQDVDHIALVLFQRLDLLGDGGGILFRLQVIFHLGHHAGRVDHHAGQQCHHRQRDRQRQPERRLLFLFAAASAAALRGSVFGRQIPAAVSARATAAGSRHFQAQLLPGIRLRAGLGFGQLLRGGRFFRLEEIRLAVQGCLGGRSLRGALLRRAVQRAFCIDTTRSFTHSFYSFRLLCGPVGHFPQKARHIF